ncbi:MAG: META domain-containing protein [Burkholderiales bacterium]|nr:META domain-containing protein [Burkholderiales bacterium]MCE7877339.1 META domain-containing protein [Betaproteobacteria bacterium PRO3]
MKRTLFTPSAMGVGPIVVALAAAVLLAVAVVSQMTSASPPFHGTRWTLVQLGSEPVTVAPARTPSIRFGGDRVAGFDGCTTFFMEGSTDPNNMRFDPAKGALAPVPCPPDFMLAGALHVALLHAVRATVDGDRMTLHAADGRVLATFRAER